MPAWPWGHCCPVVTGIEAAPEMRVREGCRLQLEAWLSPSGATEL